MRQRENDNTLLQNQQSSETVNHALPNLLDSPIADDNALAVVRFGEALVVDWKDSAWDMLFGMDSKGDPNRGDITYFNIPKLYDPILEQQRDSYQPPDTCISIDDCLNKFEQPERLAAEDTWYCPRCKEHRRALKKFDIWKTPDILVCHLKRFFDSPNRRGEMIDKLVTFPVEGLDLEKRVLKQDGKIEVYDLIGVVDRHGGPNRGHYMASAKNFIDGNWYHYDGKTRLDLLWKSNPLLTFSSSS
jgi:ubiquitin carboxyl-terminal hydrolase 4/11/15